MNPAATGGGAGTVRGPATATTRHPGSSTTGSCSTAREPALPDPRSAWQPHGVHGPSRTFDPGRFAWTDDDWPGPRSGTGVLGGVVYELHVGTFTSEGTLDAALARLDHLVDLGVDVVELMPVAAFPGRWGWGYDGVDLWAVHDGYGGPAALQRFVDACHARGLGVAPRRRAQPPRARAATTSRGSARTSPRRTRRPGVRRSTSTTRAAGQVRQLPRRERPALVRRLPRRRPASRCRARAQGRLPPPLPRRALRRGRRAVRHARPTARPRRRERPQRHRDGDADGVGRPGDDGPVGRRRAPRAARVPDRRGTRLLRRLRRRRRPRRGRPARRARQGAHPRLPARRHHVDLPRAAVGRRRRRRAPRRPPPPRLPADPRPGGQPDGGRPGLGGCSRRGYRPPVPRSTCSAPPPR